jgi:hypothetical protein
MLVNGRRVYGSPFPIDNGASTRTLWKVEENMRRELDRCKERTRDLERYLSLR